MILAVVNTGSFEWTALGENEQEAKNLLIEAYAKHVAQVDDRIIPVDRCLMADLINDGDVNFYPVQPGTVLRDGSPI